MKKKYLSVFVCFLIIMLNFSLTSTKVEAAADVEKPVLETIQIDKRVAYAGDTITFTAKISDAGGSGLRSANITYKSPITKGWEFIHLDKIDENTFVGKLPLNDTFQEGNWIVDKVDVSDMANNTTTYYNKYGSWAWMNENLKDFRNLDFTFKEKNPDIVIPMPIDKPLFIPDGKLYDNENREYRLNNISVIYKNKEISKNTVVKTSTIDNVIREEMDKLDKSKYYYDYVSVTKGYTIHMSNGIIYQGLMNDIKINVKSYDDFNQPIEAPTTEAPTTEAPTTEAPTTEIPTTEAPTVEKPTNNLPTTAKPVTKKPNIKVIRPTVNSKVISNTTNEIIGKAMNYSTVYAKVNNKIIGSAKVIKGKYSMKIRPQKSGSKVEIYAVYKKSRSSSSTYTVLDRIAPEAPLVNKITYKSRSLTGKGEKATKVYVYKGTKKFVSGTVASNGKFKLNIANQKKNTKLTVYLVDKAGNKSKKRIIKVY